MSRAAERDAARALGLKKYRTNRACKAGHIADRYTQTGMCVPCNIEQAAAWRVMNPEKHRESSIRSGARRAHIRRAYQRENSYKHKLAKWKREGISEPTRPCPALCEICERPPSAGKLLALDHCHKTNAFRGWLCFGCNTALGKFNDDPALLRKAIAYIEAQS